MGLYGQLQVAMWFFRKEVDGNRMPVFLFARRAISLLSAVPLRELPAQINAI